MAGAIDDFSLLVTLKTAEHLLQRPRYQPRLDPTQSTLAEVLAPYHFPEPYPCGLSSCRTPHQTGYLVETADQKETNIGSICGRRLFGDDFRIKANLQEQRARLKHQLDTLQSVSKHKASHLTRIATLLQGERGAKWAEVSRRAFKEAIGPAMFQQIRERARRNDVAVMRVRPATAEERDRHRAMHPGARPFQFISDKVGDLTGLDFLNHSPEQLLIDLKDKLYALDALDVRTLSPKVRKEWVDWAGTIEQRFNLAEQVLADALRFFTQTNFALIAAMGKDAQEQARLAQVRWSAAERRVIVKPTT